jgi:polysaccharide export outer membrane protein
MKALLRNVTLASLACGLLFGPVVASRAQEPAAVPAPAAPDEYRVGAGDVLEVTVIGNQDASRVAPIDPGGTITLPLVGEVPVAGRTLAQVRQQVSALLAKDYLVNPQVDVRIKEYGSRFALIVGEMRQPGRRPLRANSRLIDVLMEAGGFTPQASGDVLITRVDGTFPDGGKSLRVRITAQNATAADRAGVETELHAGDIIVAAPKAYVIVEGEVSRPGRFVIDGNLTITGGISIAGGLTRYGSSSVRIRRTDAEGKTAIVPVDLKAIRKGKAEDVLLQADDVVTVSRRLF